MKRLNLIAFAALILFAWSFAADAVTVTEGTLDIQNLASRISGDLQDYGQKRDQLVDNIKSVQKGIQKLKQDYDRAENEKEKIVIKARTLQETSQLLDFYSQFYNLNLEKVEAILPNLDRMKEAARKGVIGRASRELEDPEFIKNMKNLYGNISTFAMKFDNPRLKKEVATLLRENELLYKQGKKGLNLFDDMAKNIDKVADYLRSVYAKTVLRAKILERKKFQTGLAVELMQYALALKPIQQSMLQINPEGVIDVPEIDVSEFVDPIISDGQMEGERGATVYNDPDMDAALKNFQEGPNFLK